MPCGATAPRPLVTPDPQRPKNFRPGVVVVSCVIGVDGRAQNTKIAKSLTPEADANALEVIKRWEFKPAACNGEPIPVEMKVEVAFR